MAVSALNQIAKADAEKRFLEGIISGDIKAKVRGTYRFYREGNNIVAYGHKRIVNAHTSVIGPPQRYGILSHVYYDAKYVIHDVYTKSNFTVYYDPINEGPITNFWSSDNYSEYGMIANFEGGPAIIFSGLGVDRFMLVFGSTYVWE